VPLVPGYHGDDQDIERMKSEADKIGYPVLIKPTHGGGGKVLPYLDIHKLFRFLILNVVAGFSTFLYFLVNHRSTLLVECLLIEL